MESYDTWSSVTGLSHFASCFHPRGSVCQNLAPSCCWVRLRREDTVLIFDTLEVCITWALFVLLHVCAFQEAGGWSQPQKGGFDSAGQPWLMQPSLCLQERAVQTGLRTWTARTSGCSASMAPGSLWRRLRTATLRRPQVTLWCLGAIGQHVWNRCCSSSRCASQGLLPVLTCRASS